MRAARQFPTGFAIRSRFNVEGSEHGRALPPAWCASERTGRLCLRELRFAELRRYNSRSRLGLRKGLLCTRAPVLYLIKKGKI